MRKADAAGDTADRRLRKERRESPGDAAARLRALRAMGTVSGTDAFEAASAAFNFRGPSRAGRHRIRTARGRRGRAARKGSAALRAPRFRPRFCFIYKCR